MPTATTYGDQTISLGSRASVPGGLPPGAHGDSASLDAAQNAALASLIRNLAAVRPEIADWTPAAGRLPQPRAADPAASASPPLSSPREAPARTYGGVFTKGKRFLW